MARYDYTAEEWRTLKLDLVTQLALRGVYRPAAMTIPELRLWFAEADHDVVPDLVAELVAESDCPVEYAYDGDSVRLTDPDAVVTYLESHHRQPP